MELTPDDPFADVDWNYVKAEDPPLTIVQRARAEALHEARMVLEKKGLGGVTILPPSAELLSVAWFILEGPVPIPGATSD